MVNLISVLLFSMTLKAASLKDFIITEANNHNIDADLVLAIAYIESNLNPKLIGMHGEIGVFQLRPEYYKVTGDVKKDIKTAIQHLVTLKNKYESKHDDAWFVLFNYGEFFKFKRIKQTKYYNKVMFKYNQIKAMRYLARNEN